MVEGGKVFESGCKVVSQRPLWFVWRIEPQQAAVQ